METIPVDRPAPICHRYWIPCTIVLLLALGLATPFILETPSVEERWETTLAQRQFFAGYTEVFGIPIVAGLLLLWWVFLSRFSWLAKLTVTAFLALIGVGLFFGVRYSENDLYRGYFLIPKFTFFWQKTPDQERSAYRGSSDSMDATDLTIQPADFPRYRGRDGDGVAHVSNLAAEWTAANPPIAKYRRPCTIGYSGFAVAGNAAITMEQIDGKVAVVCYDRNTGRERWVFKDALGSWFDGTKMGDGPRSTPTIADGLVYAFGPTGVLVCLDKDGKEKWRHDVLTECDAGNTIWGLAGSPLVIGDLVVVNPGIKANTSVHMAVAAYDRKDGKRVWAAGEHQAAYSSPMQAKLGGMTQIVIFDSNGLAGIDPADGKEMWRHKWDTQMEMNDIQPLLCGDDRIFISSEAKNGCAMIKVSKEPDGWKHDAVWAHLKFVAKFSNPVRVGSAIYGLSNGDLVALDVDTGKIHWRERSRFGNGQLLVAGDNLIVQSDKGWIYLVAAEVLAYKELGSFEALEGSPKTWNTPALAGRQLFIRDNKRQMACIELPEAKR